MKYKHKTTGEEAVLQNDNYYVCSETACIPKRFIEDSCDWEKVEELDYEILSFYSGLEESPFEYIFTKQPNGLYSKGTGDCTLKHGLTYWKIYSVKRFSDGEIFTIGDNTNFGEIKRFSLMNKNPNTKGLIVEYKSKGDWQWLNSIKKIKESLFTTEDGVEIFKGDKYYLVTNDFVLGVCTGFSKSDLSFKCFAKKENAEKYICENQKKFSLNDISHLLSEITPIRAFYETKLERFIARHQ